MPQASTDTGAASHFDPGWLAAATGPDATVLQLVVDYVEANAHRPIGMADIAAACDRTPRSLQLIFRRATDTTPWAYVRSVRLARAHYDLVRADGRRDTVASVALWWGFTNSGRFSAEYRAVYGEPPHTTLRRYWPVTSAAGRGTTSA